MNSTLFRALVALGLAAGSHATWANAPVPLAAERAAIGSAGATAEAQGVGLDAVRASVCDRKWALICKDAPRPAGAADSALIGDGKRPLFHPR